MLNHKIKNPNDPDTPRSEKKHLKIVGRFLGKITHHSNQLKFLY